MSRNHITKRGTIIPLETLLGILIALLVFGTVWWGVSKFFRLSEQAENNFYDLADKIKEVNGKPSATRETFISIQDKETFLVLFIGKSAQETVVIHPEEGVPGGEVEFKTGGPSSYSPTQRFSYPAELCEGKPCLCLCREYKPSEAVNCPTIRCKPLQDVVVHQHWVNARGTGDLRRVQLQLEKLGDGSIKLTGGNVPKTS